MDMEGIMLSENKSDRERQVQYDFTFMCNLKDETNEQTKQKRMWLIDVENKLMVTRGEGGGRLGKMGEGV